VALKTQQKDRRDAFVRAALTGICGTPMVELAASDPVGPSKVGMLAMLIADATIATLDKVAPPRRVGDVEQSQ